MGETIKVNFRLGQFGTITSIPISWTAKRAEAIKAFITEHPEYTEQVVREMTEYENRRLVPYVGQKKIVTGTEVGVDPATLDPVTSQPTAHSKEIEWATYDLVGSELHWQEMDDDG